jgi:Rhodopirellula transposase DDE domain
MPSGTTRRKSRKVSPKKIPETDAIFEQVTQLNHIADVADDVLRISMDAKATGKVGPFARAGTSRLQVEAADHDFAPEATVPPVGSFLPTLDTLFVYAVTSKVTSDCPVDRRAQWWESVRERFAPVPTLVLNRDNGPENQSRRTQFMQRLVDFVQCYHLHVRLAYYPPYHSKYTPVERCWGILEQHWNGALLDSLEAVLGFARTMTWKGTHPVVELVTTTYQTGVTLTTEARDRVDAQLKRLAPLGKWFVDIVCPDCPPPSAWDT